MQKLQKKATEILTQMADKMMGHDTWEWPPQCLYFSYQPMRPKLNKEPANDEHKD